MIVLKIHLFRFNQKNYKSRKRDIPKFYKEKRQSLNHKEISIRFFYIKKKIKILY
jgi:hypothetical protein